MNTAKYIVLIIVFLTSFMLADLQVIIIAQIGSINIFMIDVIFFLILISAAIFIIKNKMILIEEKNIFYNLLLIILIFSISYGFIKFGGSAFGEGRTIYGLFAFFVPIAIFYKDSITSKEVLTFLKVVIYTSAIASTILFIIEFSIGGRFFFSAANSEIMGFSDFRGTRYLGSEDTYNILVCSLFFLVSVIYSKSTNKIKIFLGVILLLIVIITRNRTPILALGTGLIIVLFLHKKIKIFIYIAFIIIVAYLSLNFLPSELQDNIKVAYSTVFDIQSDETGNWRYLVQYQAILQGLETPFIGQGFGGYYSFYVPEMKTVIDLPPHNIFVLLFLKSGFAAVIILILSIFSFFFILFKNREKWFQNDAIHYYYLLQMIFISQLFYGLSYGLSLFFPLFAGFAIIINDKFNKEGKNLTNIKSD
jgi:hypothetical protein